MAVRNLDDPHDPGPLDDTHATLDDLHYHLADLKVPVWLAVITLLLILWRVW